jgi:signal transduction histidine kinase
VPQVVAVSAGWLTAAVVTALWWALRRALDSRTEAVARACHELRGPITAARLGVELGWRGGALSPTQLRAIHAELGRAALALEDLVAAPEALAAPRKLEAIDLAALLADSVAAWLPVATESGVQLRCSCSPPIPAVRGDRLRLAQATGNLIANAIEHGAAHVVVLGCATAGGARVEVVDDGPGLPAPLSEIVGRARRGRGARGRGLAIATAVATVHGGRLLSAPVDQGARMVLELPAAAEES